MSYADHYTGHIRLATLNLLAGLPGYSGNDSVLAQGVNGIGLTVTRDAMRGQLDWLEEQQLVRIERVGERGQIMVARLTERGMDVSQGRATVTGVQVPGPGAG